MGQGSSREGGPRLHSTEAQRIAITPEFMRLEQLKQLGCARWVFPSANHCRDEHSVAVAHKARCVGQYLGAADCDLLLLEVAGLCHDLGHGPFSHVFEVSILPKLGVRGWRHEDMSARLLWTINSRHRIGLTEEQLLRITDIINGKASSDLDWRGREWLLQVVASTVDVDRVDYLIRDAAKARVSCQHDFTQLLHNCQVLPSKSGQLQICFHADQQPLLEAMFRARYEMHRIVYQHSQVKGVEMMVADAVAAADPVLQFSQLVHEPEDFTGLTDSIVNQIRCRVRLTVKRQRQQQQQQQDSSSLGEQDSDADRLAVAAALLERIDMARFYKCVAELTPHGERFSGINAAGLAALCGGLLEESDIRLVAVSLDYGRKDQDPLQAVTLHDGAGNTFRSCFRQPPAGGFRTRLVRVYLIKDFASEEQQSQAIKTLQAAFQTLVQLCAAAASNSSSSSVDVTITHPCDEADEAEAASAAVCDGSSSNGLGTTEPKPVPQLQLHTPAAVLPSVKAPQRSQTSVLHQENARRQQQQQQLLPFSGYPLPQLPSRKRPSCGSSRPSSRQAVGQAVQLSEQQALLLGGEEAVEGDEGVLLSQLSQDDVVMLE